MNSSALTSADPTGAPSAMSGPDLTETLRALYASEINCGLESFWDGGYTLWIGDYMNGRCWSGNVEGKDVSTAGALLALAAIRLHPTSEYVTKTLGLGRKIVDEEIGWHGTGAPSIDQFQCEFCGAVHLDCTLLEHSSDCFVTHARALMSTTDGAEPVSAKVREPNPSNKAGA